MTPDEQVGKGARAVAQRLDEVAAALRTHNIEAVVVEDGEEGVGGCVGDGVTAQAATKPEAITRATTRRTWGI